MCSNKLTSYLTFRDGNKFGKGHKATKTWSLDSKSLFKVMLIKFIYCIMWL